MKNDTIALMYNALPSSLSSIRIEWILIFMQTQAEGNLYIKKSEMNNIFSANFIYMSILFCLKILYHEAVELFLSGII